MNARTRLIMLMLTLVILLGLSVIGVGAQDQQFAVVASESQANQETVSVETTLGSTSDKTLLYFFYGAGCPHCAQMEPFLDELSSKYSDLVIKKYEVYSDDDNRKLMIKLAGAYGRSVSGVPTVFLGPNMVVGFNEGISKTVESEVQNCIDFGCYDPIERLNEQNTAEDVVSLETGSSPHEDPDKAELMRQITIPAVLGSAVVDAINPCAFAVLIILLSTVLAAGRKKRVLFAGLAFTLSVYLSYFLMGIGLFSALRAAGLTTLFYTVVAVLAIIVGLFNLKDYLWYGKWFVMEVPLKWRPKMKMLIKGVTSVPGAFLIGFVVSLFLLPCTSGPYIVILGLLAETATKTHALRLLLLYNLVFVLPMIIITLAIYFGFTTTQKAEHWRTRKLRVLHLIAGIIILLVGLFMLGSVILGYV